MGLDPSTFGGNGLPPGSNVTNMNQQAQQLIQASIAGYGVSPDPQISTESMMTGASPGLSYALAQGNPAFKHTLLSQPIGQSQFSSIGAPPPTSLYNDPYSYDPKLHAQAVQSIPDTVNTFKSMDDLPVANMGWYNSILQGDKNTVKRWQQYLSSNGFYNTYDSNGKATGKGEVNGYNTPDFSKAMDQWALAYFLPQALYSRDPQEITNARQFLSMRGFDADAIAQTTSRDPAQREKVIDGWLQAQGPGANKVKALNLFADQFGSEALPDQLNKLRGDGVFGGIGDFLHHFIPFIGSDDEQKLKDLTPAEQQLLAPSLQQAHDQSPFMKFLGDVFSAPSKALVTTGLFFGSAVHGDVENPFDDQSKIRQTADSFVNNPMSSIFGQQFVKDHPWLSTFGNIAVGLLDDPLTYVPFVGEANLAEKIGKSAGETIEGFDAMSKAGKTQALVDAGKMTKVEGLTGGLVSHRVGTLRYGAIAPRTVMQALKDKNAGLVTAKLLNPIETSQVEVAKALTTPNLDHGLVRSMLNITRDEDAHKVDDILRLGQTGQDGAHMDVLNYLRDPKNHLADRLNSMDMLVHRHQWDKVLSDVKNWNPDKAMPVWQMMHMNDAGSLLMLNHPDTYLDTVRDSSMIAGADPAAFQQFSSSFWKASGDDLTRLKLARDYEDTLKESWDKRLADVQYQGKSGEAGYKAWQESLNPTSRNVKGEQLFASEHQPGTQGNETSFAKTTQFTKDSGGYTADQLNAQQAHLEAQRDILLQHGQYLREVNPGNPAAESIDAAYQQAGQDLQDQIDQWAAEHGGVESQTAVPMHTTQSAIYHHTAYTPAQMAAYLNPRLRQSEWIQKRWGVDNAMKVWKQITLGKPSTRWRILFGDESSRGLIHGLLNSPSDAWDYMKGVVTRDGTAVDKAIVDHPEMMISAHTLNQMQAGMQKFVPMVAGQTTYRQNFANLIEQHYGKQQWVKDWVAAVEKPLQDGGDWEKAGQDALKDFLRSDHPEAQFARTEAHIPDLKGKNSALDDLAATRHTDLATLSHPDPRDPDRMMVFNWLKSGKVDHGELKDLEKRVQGSTDETYALPQIHGLPPIIGSPVGNWYENFHANSALKLQNARARVFVMKYNMEKGRLSGFYANELKEGRLTTDDIHSMADASAATWTKKSTYQGARSVLGSTLRTVAPFWGATANSNKFYLHTLMEHPEAIPAFVKGESAITQQQGQGGLRVHATDLPLIGNYLTHFGLAAGDSFSFEPFNALFLTREGFGGLLPGAGPVFNVGLGAMPQSFRDTVAADVPGMEFAANGSPIAPWATNLISAFDLARGGNGFEAPFVGRASGYYEKLVDEKLQQMESDWEQGGRKGPAPTVDQAKKDVSLQQAVTGAAGFALPVGAATENAKETAIKSAEQQWDPGLSDADKKTFFAENPDVADFFKYIDPHTPETPVNGQDSKADILSRSPWVLSYTTGKTKSTIPGRTTSADNDLQYKKDVEAGNIQTLSPTEYITKMRQQEQSNQAWNAFDGIQNQYQDFLLASGSSTNSNEAKAWRKANYDWRIQGLVNEYPEWGAAFVKQTSQSAVGQQFSSKPFYSVSTFNVIPRNPALETKTTALWRAALVRRDQATNALYQVMASSGSTHEKEMILQGLTQQLDQLAAQDPAFKAQISRYRYSSLDDLVNFQAGQQLNTAQGYPNAG